MENIAGAERNHAERSPVSVGSLGFCGRASELARLDDFRDAVLSGRGASVLIEGSPGIGKTAFVHAAIASLFESALFIEAKHEFDSRRPYGPFAGVFAALARRVLSGASEESERWRLRFERASELIADVAPDILPRFEYRREDRNGVRGVDDVGGSYIQRARVIEAALAELLVAYGPGFVLFVDDLQWADTASLRLCRRLADSPSPGLIFAFREGEIDKNRSARALVDSLIERGSTRIILGPLAPAEIAEGLSRSFPGIASNEGLADKLFGGSGGNPLYLGQILGRLLEKAALHRRPAEGAWVLEGGMETLCSEDCPDEVADFIFARLKALPPDERRALACASCLDEAFCQDYLTLAVDSPRSAVSDRLRDLVDRGYISALNADEYRFSHDKVRSAAAALLSDEDRADIHLRLVRNIHSFGLQQDGSISYPSRYDLLSAAEHLRYASKRIRDPLEARSAVDLLLKAANESRGTGAYAVARSYLDAAFDLIGPDAWIQEYDLALGVHAAAAEVSLLCGESGEAERLVDIGIRYARTRLDALPFVEVRVMRLVGALLLREAAELCFKTGGELGFGIFSTRSIDRRPPIFVDIALRIALRLPLPLLLALRPRPDPAAAAAQRIMVRGFAAIYMSMTPLVPAYASRALWLSLLRCRTRLLSFVLTYYTIVPCSGGRQLARGARYAHLIRKLIERDGEDGMEAKVGFSYPYFIQHWYEPFSACLPRLYAGFEAGMKNGDYEYGALAAGVYCNLRAYAGAELAAAESELHSIEERLIRLGIERGRLVIRWHRQTILNLMGRSPDPDPCLYHGPLFDERLDYSRLIEAGDKTALFYLPHFHMIIAALLGQWPRALDESDLAAGYRPFAAAQTNEAVFVFFRSLCLAVNLGAAAGESRRSLRRSLVSHLAELRRWAAHSPRVFGYRVDLVEAELARAEGRTTGLEARYRAAIAGAVAAGIRLEEALARERYALYLEAVGDEGAARGAMWAASDVYAAWGAAAKLRALETERPWLAAKAVDPSARRNDEPRSALEEIAELVGRDADPEELLERALRLFVDRAIADRSFFVDTKDSRLVIANACGGKGAMPFPPVLDAEREALMRYVSNSGQKTVVDDSETDLVFASLRSRVANGASAPSGASALSPTWAFRSALCMPIAKAGGRPSYLLLESDDVGAFSGERVGGLEPLLAQANLAFEAIAARRLRESLVEEREALLRAGRLASVGTLSAEIAHEINAPNHVVRLNVEAARARLAELLEEAQDAPESTEERGEWIQSTGADILRCLDDAATASSSIGAISSQLKGLVRERSRHRLLDLNESVGAAFDLFGVYIRKYTDHFSFSPAPDLPPVAGDRGRLQQLIMIFVENACQALDDRGERICASTSFDEISGEAVCAIEDEGRGIPGEILSHLGEPFLTARGQEGGTGLGLAVAAAIVKDHGGLWRITRRSSRGTRVEVRLPAARRAGIDQEESSHEA